MNENAHHVAAQRLLAHSCYARDVLDVDIRFAQTLLEGRGYTEAEEAYRNAIVYIKETIDELCQEGAEKLVANEVEPPGTNYDPALVLELAKQEAHRHLRIAEQGHATALQQVEAGAPEPTAEEVYQGLQRQWRRARIRSYGRLAIGAVVAAVAARYVYPMSGWLVLIPVVALIVYAFIELIIIQSFPPTPHLLPLHDQAIYERAARDGWVK